MTGWRGKTEPFDYMKTIQPIWDKHCVKCHDFGENKPAGQKLLLAGDRTHSFNASYIDLWSRNYLSCPGGGPAAHYEEKAWGSHPSKLVKVLEGGLPKTSPGHAKHKKVKLSKDELQAIYTWIDLNAVYYPTYECAYPNNPNGRSPLTGAQYSQLQKLTGVHFIRNNATNVRTKLSFERPEKSPCLKISTRIPRNMPNRSRSSKPAKSSCENDPERTCQASSPANGTWNTTKNTPPAKPSKPGTEKPSPKDAKNTTEASTGSKAQTPLDPSRESLSL